MDEVIELLEQLPADIQRREEEAEQEAIEDGQRKMMIEILERRLGKLPAPLKMRISNRSRKIPNNMMKLLLEASVEALEEAFE